MLTKILAVISVLSTLIAAYFSRVADKEESRADDAESVVNSYKKLSEGLNNEANTSNNDNYDFNK